MAVTHQEGVRISHATPGKGGNLKKLFCTIVMLAMLSPLALAENTSSKVPGSGNLKNHYHTYEDSNSDTWRPRNRFSYGGGADIVLWESNHPFCESLGVQARHDFNNRETSAMVVVRVNLWKFFNQRS